jgi:hypothetical protein
MFNLKGQIVQNLFDYRVQNVRCMITNMLFNNQPTVHSPTIDHGLDGWKMDR